MIHPSPQLQEFIRAVTLSEAPRPELTDSLAAQYPYFTLPAAIELKRSSPDDQRKRMLMARVALNAADSQTLFRLIDPEGTRFARFYPDTNTSATPSTEDALDTFMQNYGNPDPKEQALLEKLIFNPVATDYASVLIKESKQHPEAPAEQVSEQDSRLDAFLASYPAESTNHTPAPTPEPEPEKQHKARKVPTPAADSPLSESLAKFYIKRHRYDKAYEIISQLSLNFPEKSIYFADQLRFLRKLMAGQRLANKK